MYGGLGGSGFAVLRIVLVNMLCFALIYGLAATVGSMAAAALEAPQDVTSAADPLTVLTSNRAAVVRQAVLLAPVIAVSTALGGSLIAVLLRPLVGDLRWALTDGLFVGAISGIAGALCYALAGTAWGQWTALVRFWLPLTGRLPWDTAAFLDDAYQRGVLRQTGAVYQFRHIRLQHHLARGYREGR